MKTIATLAFFITCLTIKAQVTGKGQILHIDTIFCCVDSLETDKRISDKTCSYHLEPGLNRLYSKDGLTYTEGNAKNKISVKSYWHWRTFKFTQKVGIWETYKNGEIIKIEYYNDKAFVLTPIETIEFYSNGQIKLIEYNDKYIYKKIKYLKNGSEVKTSEDNKIFNEQENYNK